MKSRFFWEKRTCKKFSIVFESDEIIIGSDRKNKHRTFRKDTGLIAFSRREILEMRLADLTKNEVKQIKLKIATVFVILICCLVSVTAQTPPLVAQDDFQSWNDVQLTVPLSKKVDFITQFTMRFGKNISRLNDGRFQFGIVWHPNKTWTFQPFYWNIRSRDSRGRFRHEDRFNLRIGYKFPIKKFGLSHRSWFEYRIRATGNSWRYRPSLTFEKNLPKKFNAKVYFTEESFYDSLLKKISRTRSMIGVNKTMTKKLSLDIFYMRQNDGFSRPGDLNVIGTTWKIKL